MRLSEAMRAGIEVTEPAVRSMLVMDSTGQEAVAACALGAAILGAACRDLSELLLEFPCLVVWIGNSCSRPLFQAITEWNDESTMTREQIADFIAWLEDGGALSGADWACRT